MHCCSTHYLLNYYSNTSVFSCWWCWIYWSQSGHTKYGWTNKPCDKPWAEGSKPAQSFQWQPLFATKLNSTGLIWRIETWEYFNDVVGKMIQRTMDICRISKRTKSHGKRKPGMMSRTRSANLRSSGSVAWAWEGRCTLQDCHNFSCGKVYSFVVGHDDISWHSSRSHP